MINTFLVLMYKLLLDILFYFYVYPIYGSEPYFAEYGSADFLKWLIASVLTVAIWLFMSRLYSRDTRPSVFFILVQFFIIIVPSLVLFGMQDRPYFHVLLLCSAFFLLNMIVRLMPNIRIPPPPALLAFGLVAIGLICITYVYIGLISTGGVSRFNFDFYSVYDVREKYKMEMLPWFDYFVPWVAYVINMAFLVYFYSKKIWFLVFLVVVAQLLLFGMTNFKSFLFLPIVVLGIIVVRKYLTQPRLILLGLFASIGAGLVINAAGEDMGMSMVRRVLFVPGALHGLYFDYFSANPSAAMAGTRFAYFFSSHYDVNSIDLIARYFWGTKINPDVGWVGDAFSQFGWAGVIVYTIILAVLLKITDSLATGIPYPHTQKIEGMIVGVAIVLCESALFTTLLTHGFIILLVAFWILSYFWRRRPLTGC